MIDVKEAVKIAFDYLKQLYSVGNQVKDVLLEEVALSDDEKYWYITIGFSRPVTEDDPIREAFSEIMRSKRYQRDYKVFQVDSDSGQVRSMKIRAA